MLLSFHFQCFSVCVCDILMPGRDYMPNILDYLVHEGMLPIEQAGRFSLPHDTGAEVSRPNMDTVTRTVSDG